MLFVLFFHYQHSFFCGVLLMQLIPARGRLRLIVERRTTMATMQLIPARGRLRACPARRRRHDLMQLIPARGRLQSGESSISSQLSRCSLSPRGDGYLLPVRGSRVVLLMQLIPARGRLRAHAMLCDVLGRCSLSPRGDGYDDLPAGNKNLEDAA